MNERIPIIDGLRGSAILLVVFYHIFERTHFAFNVQLFGMPFEFHTFTQAGFLGVEVFFFVSGFCLMLPYALWACGRRPKPELREYISRRFWKIVPSYYLALAFIAIFDPINAQPGIARGTDVLLHATFLHSFSTLAFPSLNGNFWSLATEVQFYVVFPLLALLFVRRPALALAVCVLVTLAYSNEIAQRQLDGIFLWAYQLPGFLVLFGLGMATAYAYERWIAGATIDAKLRAEFAIVASLCIVGIGYLFEQVNRAGGGPVAWMWQNTHRLEIGLLLTLFTLSASAATLQFQRAVANPVLRFFSDISYNMYLWNAPVIAFVIAYWQSTPGTVWGWSVAFKILLLCTGMAFVVTRFYERPLMRKRWSILAIPKFQTVPAVVEAAERSALLLICAAVLIFAFSGCGGGGGSASLAAPPGAPAGGAPTPLPPPALQSTVGRIGLFQVDDRNMSASQIQQDASRYDAVWAAFTPSAWSAGHRTMVIADYFLPQEDRSRISGHDLAWWQANHPDWILYSCKPNGTPTTQFAYMPGVHKPDVPLDIANPLVVQYMVHDLMAPHAIANGYNALATDEVLFDNVMQGGNPNLGQQVLPGYFGCGIYSNGSFVRRYNGPHDPKYAKDILNFVTAERQILRTDSNIAPYHLMIVVNHSGSVYDPNEPALLAQVDAVLDETGFADYGNYDAAANAGLFRSMVEYMRYVQARNLPVFVIDKFVPDGDAVTPQHREYALATYLMGNEGAAYLYVAPSAYGSEEYFPEYQAQLGAACGEYYGGPGYDAANPHVYYRRFANGLAVVNSGSLPRAAETAHLPSGKTYTDVDQRPINDSLNIKSNDAYVLLTAQNGCT